MSMAPTRVITIRSGRLTHAYHTLMRNRIPKSAFRPTSGVILEIDASQSRQKFLNRRDASAV
jgi:hypothetical protein